MRLRGLHVGDLASVVGFIYEWDNHKLIFFFPSQPVEWSLQCFGHIVKVPIYSSSKSNSPALFRINSLSVIELSLRHPRFPLIPRTTKWDLISDLHAFKGRSLESLSKTPQIESAFLKEHSMFIKSFHHMELMHWEIRYPAYISFKSSIINYIDKLYSFSNITVNQFGYIKKQVEFTAINKNFTFYKWFLNIVKIKPRNENAWLIHDDSWFGI